MSDVPSTPPHSPLPPIPPLIIPTFTHSTTNVTPTSTNQKKPPLVKNNDRCCGIMSCIQRILLFFIQDIAWKCVLSLIPAELKESTDSRMRYAAIVLLSGIFLSAGFPMIYIHYQETKSFLSSGLLLAALLSLHVLLHSLIRAKVSVYAITNVLLGFVLVIPVIMLTFGERSGFGFEGIYNTPLPLTPIVASLLLGEISVVVAWTTLSIGGALVIFFFTPAQYGMEVRNLALFGFFAYVFTSSMLACLFGIMHNLKHKELKDALMHAEKLSSIMTKFSLHLSHEIRTPLNAIVGFSEMLSTDPAMSKEEQQHLLFSLNQASNHLSNLVNNVLDLSKLQMETGSNTQTQFALYEMVEEVINTFSATAEGKGIRLWSLVKCGSPNRVVIGDYYRLKQILYNIVGNAIKFCSKGHIMVRVEEVEGSSKNKFSEFVFSVIDTGIGMEESALRRLFQPFSQVHHYGAAFGGTGLGLAIVKNILESMGGEISVTSEKGVGSKFVFKLNMTVEYNSRPPPPVVTGDILLVTDDKQTTEVIKTYLPDCKVTQVPSSMQTALNNIHIQTTPYDGVVIDLGDSFYTDPTNFPIIQYLLDNQQKCTLLVPNKAIGRLKKYYEGSGVSFCTLNPLQLNLFVSTVSSMLMKVDTPRGETDIFTYVNLNNSPIHNNNNKTEETTTNSTTTNNSTTNSNINNTNNTTNTTNINTNTNTNPILNTTQHTVNPIIGGTTESVRTSNTTTTQTTITPKFNITTKTKTTTQSTTIQQANATSNSVNDILNNANKQPTTTSTCTSTNIVHKDLKILIVEDNKMNQEVISRQIARLKYKADIVGNGLDAFHSYQNQYYDVILMDCQMPVMDGYESTQKIRALEKDRGVKRPTYIVALTASVSQVEKQHSFEVGMDCILPKPLSINSLDNVLSTRHALKHCKSDKPILNVDHNNPNTSTSNSTTSTTNSTTSNTPTPTIQQLTTNNQFNINTNTTNSINTLNTASQHTNHILNYTTNTNTSTTDMLPTTASIPDPTNKITNITTNHITDNNSTSSSSTTNQTGKPTPQQTIIDTLTTKTKETFTTTTANNTTDHSTANTNQNKSSTTNSTLTAPSTPTSTPTPTPTPTTTPTPTPTTTTPTTTTSTPTVISQTYSTANNTPTHNNTNNNNDNNNAELTPLSRLRKRKRIIDYSTSRKSKREGPN